MRSFEPPPLVTSVLHFMGFLKLHGKKKKSKEGFVVSPRKSKSGPPTQKALTSCANPSSKVQLWSNLQVLFSLFQDQCLRKQVVKSSRMR